MFHKDIANTIYPRVLANQTVGGLFFSELETYANAGASSITGLELNLFSELDKYLPIEGFFITFNATISDGESELDVQMISETADSVDIQYWVTPYWLYSFAVDFYNSENTPEQLLTKVCSDDQITVLSFDF